MSNISSEWFEWKKTNCIWYYEYYKFTSQGLVVEPNCNKHCFTCVDCECYRNKENEDNEESLY